MAILYFIGGSQITGQFIANGKVFPAGWLQNADSESLSAEGVETLTEVWPTLESGNYYNGSHSDDWTEHTRTYLQEAASPGLSGSWVGNAAIQIPAGWLLTIAIKENDDSEEPHDEEIVNIGTTDGGSDIVADYPITHHFDSLIINKYFYTGTTIYITTTANFTYSIAVQQ